MPRVPVIAITGRLGAGKTTLLNHLLRTPGARLGVVINDFGELNVDAALVSGQVDEAAAISGGCLCCLPDTGGLDVALARLSEPRLRLDAIIVEASGVADPIALARVIHASRATRVRFGGVVEVVDALNERRSAEATPGSIARVAAASLIVISKGDRLLEASRRAALAALAARLQAAAPHAEIVCAERGRIDPLLVFDTAAADDPVDELPIARLLREDAASANGHGHGHSHEHAAAAAISLTSPASAAALVALLESPPRGASRIKGRVRVRHGSRERGYLLNLVGRTIDVARLTRLPGQGELVIIGHRLDSRAAEARLAELQESRGAEEDAAGLRRLERYLRLSGGGSA